MGFCQIRGPLKSSGWLVPELVEWPADWQAQNEKMDQAYPIPWLTSTRPGKSMGKKKRVSSVRTRPVRCTETSVCLGCKNIWRPGSVFAPHISQLEISRPILSGGFWSVFSDPLTGISESWGRILEERSKGNQAWQYANTGRNAVDHVACVASVFSLPWTGEQHDVILFSRGLLVSCSRHPSQTEPCPVLKLWIYTPFSKLLWTL